MASILNFTDFVNRKRNTSKATEPKPSERGFVKDAIDSVIGGISVEEFQRVASGIASAKRPKHTPTPSDPENEKRGSKYEATRDLDIVAVAKLIRKDISAAKKSGQLPKSMKVSVKSRRGHLSQSISVDITALPSGFMVYSQGYLDATEYLTDFCPDKIHMVKRYTAEMADVLSRLKDIVDSYNRDNSDPMTDYFDVRFYDSVRLCQDYRESIRDNAGKA